MGALTPCHRAVGRPSFPGRRAALCGLAALAGCARGAAIEEHALRDGIDVRLDGEGQTWRASLLLPGRGGRTTEIALGREVRVPLGAEVRFALASRDYICDFSLPELGARDFAAPGVPGALRVRPPRAGKYMLRGDEMCGLPHGEQAIGWFVVEEHATWKAWLTAKVRAAGRETRTKP
jgi:heme/copper-type cytochrome/quinol oxidase subunit 2